MESSIVSLLLFFSRSTVIPTPVCFCQRGEHLIQLLLQIWSCFSGDPFGVGTCAPGCHPQGCYLTLYGLLFVESSIPSFHRLLWLESVMGEIWTNRRSAFGASDPPAIEVRVGLGQVCPESVIGSALTSDSLMDNVVSRVTRMAFN
ncbi:hypothetical protein PanWU01x14_069230 [Parasponia andersonii]|uniref:Secreted protein n=1 Tax=Parasponia andersonii TaxID=3476 RepID=A0A2P5DFL8_PARAD|nr:hypothetical protein PanWU01x14_069230 [Parasponia andersonii]